MKSTFLLSFIFICLTINAQDKSNIALGNITWGMTKSEIKKEFKKNKSLYTNYQLGNFFYRYYYQNNTYDKKGGVDYVRLTIKGGGMYGIPDAQARMVFKDLVTMIESTGFNVRGSKTVDSGGLEYTVGEVYSFESEEKNKIVHIALIAGGQNTFVNVGIEPYSVGKIEYTEKNTF